MLTKCTWVGLYTSDRLLLEAIRQVKVVHSHGESNRGDPRSDRRQVQDFTTELWVLVNVILI